MNISDPPACSEWWQIHSNQQRLDTLVTHRSRTDIYESAHTRVNACTHWIQASIGQSAVLIICSPFLPSFLPSNDRNPERGVALKYYRSNFMDILMIERWWNASRARLIKQVIFSYFHGWTRWMHSLDRCDTLPVDTARSVHLKRIVW